MGLPFFLGYENGLAAAKSSNKPVMFFVTATWCGWCKRLARESFTDPQIKKLLENFVLVIVDGVGDSTGMHSVTDVRTMAVAYLDLLDRLNLEQVDIVGLAMG